ncbi:hypothetical protein DICA3_D25708 [Diutina catenulata]
MSEVTKVYPDSTDKFPRLGGFFSDAHYPKFAPVDTKKETTQVLKFGVSSVAFAYGWLYIFKRTQFKLGLPLTVLGFATVATASKGIITNLREKNDAWNAFWSVGLGNAAVLSAGFRSMPIRNKILTGFAGAAIAAFLDNFVWAQSPSSVGQDQRFAAANSDSEQFEEKQKFWDVWTRRPLSQTVEELGVGRGIIRE